MTPARKDSTLNTENQNYGVTLVVSFGYSVQGLAGQGSVEPVLAKAQFGKVERDQTSKNLAQSMLANIIQPKGTEGRQRDVTQN